MKLPNMLCKRFHAKGSVWIPQSSGSVKRRIGLRKVYDMAFMCRECQTQRYLRYFWCELCQAYFRPAHTTHDIPVNINKHHFEGDRQENKIDWCLICGQSSKHYNHHIPLPPKRTLMCYCSECMADMPYDHDCDEERKNRNA